MDTTKEHSTAPALVIFIHGFMGSPNQFEDLMLAVYERGYSYACMLLPGHGASAKAFASHTLADWEAHLYTQINKYAQKYAKIYLVGHSMGGLLALNASLNHNIAGIFLISTPLKINLFNFNSFTRRLRLLFYTKSNTIKSEYLRANSIKMSIFSFPLLLKPTIQFYKLIRKTKSNLKGICTPVFMVHSQKDETVSYKSAQLLYSGLCNTHRTRICIKKSWHAYYTQEERKLIAESLLNMILD